MSTNEGPPSTKSGPHKTPTTRRAESLPSSVNQPGDGAYQLLQPGEILARRIHDGLDIAIPGMAAHVDEMRGGQP